MGWLNEFFQKRRERKIQALRDELREIKERIPGILEENRSAHDNRADRYSGTEGYDVMSNFLDHNYALLDALQRRKCAIERYLQQNA
jgi:DNA-binding transcriptional regulator GbsR (MarR family)